MNAPVLAFTQGDPAGIGPETIVRYLSSCDPRLTRWRPLLIAERPALEVLKDSVPGDWPERLVFFESPPVRDELAALAGPVLAVLDPVGAGRRVVPGQSGSSDAAGAVAALDVGIEAVRSGLADALVTAQCLCQVGIE